MKTNKFKTIIALILCFILVGGLATSLTFNVLQYRTIKGLGAQDVATVNADDILVTACSSEFMAMSATTVADSPYTRNLTVTPDKDVPGTLIDWTIAFVDTAPSTVQNTVSNYATITPTSDGAMTATLTVFKPFSYQIIVTASLRDDSAINAICKVDYQMRSSVDYRFKCAPESNAIFQYAVTTTSEGTLKPQGAPSFQFSEFNHNFDRGIQFFHKLYEYESDNRSLIWNLREKYPQMYNNINVFLYMIESNDFICDVFRWKYTNRRYSEADGKSGIEFPFFNYAYYNNSNFEYDSYIIAGFYSESKAYQEESEFMMCRFLGLYPTSAIERIGGRELLSVEALDWSGEKYITEMRKCYSTEELNFFKKGVNYTLQDMFHAGTNTEYGLYLFDDENVYRGLGLLEPLNNQGNFTFIIPEIPLFTVYFGRDNSHIGECRVLWALSLFNV